MTATTFTSTVKLTKDWARLFSRNTQQWQQFAANFDVHTVQLDPAFIKSIQAFQLAEQSEGKRLMAIAQQYAARHNAPDYVKAIQQFIGEEQRHADYLSRVLHVNGAGTLTKQWTDSVFRHLRKLVGPEMMLSLLLMAEIIAIAYYSSLARASQDPQAKQLFERILQDETTHIQFHCEYMTRSTPLLDSLRWSAQRVFLGLVTIVIWLDHSHVLKHRFSSVFQMMDYCNHLLTKCMRTALSAS
ncbi:ferritin-like domain-containing protein [Leptothoe spongobia]|uniref:Ferritin-like domain-containing protein n=1 Tax=Leptothoe spongobia TAU-MAC 1115 TaxID=1967444 RepID=A0A947DIK3_9CYAN|nr:ferritin-like domain-containing protein [Leptothoe spongobia]MBT9317612.1 ferritin-like domain-containing protein [Leptothoe spongobia TAU-MAC 1115]